MKLAISIVAVVLSLGCTHAGESTAGPAPAELSKWSWLPGSSDHASEISQIPADAEVSFSIPKDAALRTHSEAPGDMDMHGNFAPSEKRSIVVDGGALDSVLGAVKKRAQWGDWDEVWTSSSRSDRAGWGFTLTDGEIILPRSMFENPRTDRFVQNLFAIEAFGDSHVLIRLDPAKGHRLCFLESGGSKVPTAGYIGSRAEVNGNILERKADGWYLGTARMSN